MTLHLRTRLRALESLCGRQPMVDEIESGLSLPCRKRETELPGCFTAVGEFFCGIAVR